MCRHITGVEQPAKKIKLDNNEKLERKRTYDQVKRKRKKSWQKNRNWLVHNSEIDRMTCSICIQYASSDRTMVTLVMMMFQVMTILTFFLHYNFFKLNNYYIIFSNCPHDGRASRISGGLVDFYIY